MVLQINVTTFKMQMVQDLTVNCSQNLKTLVKSFYKIHILGEYYHYYDIRAKKQLIS